MGEEGTSTAAGAGSFEEPPRPPDYLIDRVAGCDNDKAEEHRRRFDMTGKQSVLEIKSALAGIGLTLDDFPRILDFGCGCARVDRWLQYEVSSSKLHGCDIDEQAIAWNQRNLPGMKFSRNNPEPPLPYGDESFDLILNHSVFTHLDERMQDLWLTELHRVLRPGGIAMLSVHGPFAFGLAEYQCRFEGDTPAVLRKELELNGILFVTSDAWVGSSFPSFYHTTYHAPWYVFEHWSRWFLLRAYLPQSDLGFQDVVLLQRDDSDRPVLSIAAAGAIRHVVPEGTGGADDKGPLPSLAEVDANRVSPVVGEILERLGQRVARLEAALAEEHMKE